MPARPRILRFSDLKTGSRPFHLARTDDTALRRSGSAHSHDFGEVFWMESGSLRHWTPYGDREIHKGAVIFIRPKDQHALKPIGRDMSFMNLALPAETLRTLAGRYYRGRANWPWSSDLAEPHVANVGSAGVEKLSRAAEELAARSPNLLAVEAFVLSLLADVAPPTGPTVPPDCPDWLADAMEQFRQPQHLAGGRDAFLRLAGRSPEHVGRVVRKVFGDALSEHLNSLQLDAAAQMLVMTSRNILDIAMDCGFGSPSYFYARFRERHGLPPRQYRLQQRTMSL